MPQNDDLYAALPGTEELPPPPSERIEMFRQRRGESYRPRTKHLLPDGRAKYTNRLFLESSPYLLQHAHNPVNWFAWGEEAFDLAEKLGRPLLVSIGYATCHWCHVMEEESFESEEVAEYLNRNFIAVKVDREERPDVDTVYMSAVHAMGMQGGWPLNVFLTPQKKPFYGGTYFPPHDYGGGIGFLTLLKRIRETFDSAPERVTRAGEQLTDAVREMLAAAEPGSPPQPAWIERAVRACQERFDPKNGGMIGAPKFPSSLPVRLLLHNHLRTGDRDSLSMADFTLQRMAAGGICDQVGGGFHRYATDSAWLIPHFEKMLYDNALLAVCYLEGYQATGSSELAAVARDILRYLKRDMASPDGGFYAASDADSLSDAGHREEGFFFTWTPEELVEVLGREKAAVVASCYGVTPEGNFEGRSVLHRKKEKAQLCAELKMAPEELERVLAEARELLYRARMHRPAPIRDEKILASWNGLAVSSFARAAMVLNDDEAVSTATACADFMLRKMTREGKLFHSFQEGEAKGEGFLDDYACFIAGLIDLFEATGQPTWIEHALKLTATVNEDFEDREGGGGFFMTGPRHEELISREKPAYDGVVPSGNSVMAMNLLRLSALTDDPHLLEKGKNTIDAFASRLASAPTALAEMLLALDYLHDVPREIVIVAPAGKPEAAQPLLERLRRVYLPNRVLAVATEGAGLERTAAMLPLLREKKAAAPLATAYLCENKSCRRPTSDPEEFFQQLKETRRRTP